MHLKVEQIFAKAIECIARNASLTTDDTCGTFSVAPSTVELPSSLTVSCFDSNVIVSGFPNTRMIDSYRSDAADNVHVAAFHILGMSPLKGAQGKINIAKEVYFFQGSNFYYTNIKKKYLAFDGNLFAANDVVNYG